MGRPMAQYKHKKGEIVGRDIWTPIPGFNGVYEINYCGDVRRTCGKGKRTITPIIKKGVWVVRLVADGKRKEHRVHCLMGQTFLPKPPGKEFVLWHKNGIKTDNVPGNLIWIRRQELGKMTGGSSRRRPVVKLDQQGEVVKAYPSARAAAKDNFMSYQTVIDRCNGICKSEFAPDGYKYDWDEEE